MTADSQAPTTLVLGAGLAGLGCALALDEAGRPYRLLEAEARVGGLVRSEKVDGFVFDATGHWLHLRDASVRALVEEVLGEDAVWVERTAAIFSHGRLVPYPFQTNTWALPLEARRECLLGFVEARHGEAGSELRAREPASFREHVLRSLGAGIGRHFMFPYNEKLWGVDLDELSVAWMGRFVPSPSEEDVLAGALGPLARAQGYNARFVYPRHGGIQTLSDRLAARLSHPAECSRRAVEVHTGERWVRIEDGERIDYDALVSTMPLPALVAACTDAPDAVREAAAGLRATSVTYVSLGVRCAPDSPEPSAHWVYFPEKRFPFYRAGCASAAVPTLAPEGFRSFYVEFSHHGPTDSSGFERAAINGLREAGLIADGDEVVVSITRELPGAYVLFDHEHEARRSAVLDWLDSRGVFSVGRYGAWEYSSMEDALLGGRAAADRILGVTS